MDVPRALAVAEGVSAVLIAATWYGVLRRGDVYVDWRSRASFVSLIFVSVAVSVQLVLSIITQLRPLAALDAASMSGGFNAFVAHLWLWSFFATGILAFAGLALAILGKGSPRIPAGAWSFIVLSMFLVNLVLTVNSFH